MSAHRLRAVVSSPKFSGPHWACSCGAAAYYVRTREAAKAGQREHVAKARARDTLAAALARWEASPAQLFLDVENMADWAERDQDEVRQCGDSEEVEREARNNMRIVRELARAFRALLILDGWGGGQV